jgi:dCMP deaminase
MLLGLTGLYCSGKDTAANQLVQKHGFIHYSLSDAIREEATGRGLPHTRESLISLGNELRTTYGPGVLAERALAKAQPGRDYAISSIRNPSEVDTLRRVGQLLPNAARFYLVDVFAPMEVRLQRMLARGRPGDPKTLEELREKEEREKSGDPTQQQLHRCAAMADAILVNDGTEDVLHGRIDELLRDARAGRLKRRYD